MFNSRKSIRDGGVGGCGCVSDVIIEKKGCLVGLFRQIKVEHRLIGDLPTSLSGCNILSITMI